MDVRVLDEVYYNHKRHLRALKLLGSLVLISIMSATLGMTINAIQCGCQNMTTSLVHTRNHTDDLHGRSDVNHTSCLRSKTYDLPDGLNLKVCEAPEGVFLDLRYDANGMTLNFRQWDYLFRIDRLISSTVRHYLHT